ncbi:MAG: type II toxin-antitoxin system VapC family toxin [Longimicrobiales bacterium]|nr:type II toxin-antitoxin system VapC family toxin [Longimicrobiales bacterium]
MVGEEERITITRHGRPIALLVPASGARERTVDEAITTSLWPLEISHGLLVAERKGRIDATSSARFARLLLTLPVIVEPLDRRRVFEITQPLARRYSLSAYDAHYLELSVRWAVPLATLDGKLMAAAEAEGIRGFEV